MSFLTIETRLHARELTDTVPILPLKKLPRILVVDDEYHARQLVKLAFAKHHYHMEEASNGAEAIDLIRTNEFDLVLLDLNLPKLNGLSVLQQIRALPHRDRLKVIVVSGSGDSDQLSDTVFAGADDFVSKPFSIVQLRARISAALRLKEAQDHSHALSRKLETVVHDRDGELHEARGALVLALAKLVERRSRETGPHLVRLQRYCRVMGNHAAREADFRDCLNPDILRDIEQSAPLHDIGKVAVPDEILNKPGSLSSAERAVMETHTTIGADTLTEVSRQYHFATKFFPTAIEIARHHHERWDGDGYPHRLAGEAIPISARIVALADVYDALRSRRIYKPAYSHVETIQKMNTDMRGHFDPRLLRIFLKRHEHFERVFGDYREAA